jgi:PAS domain S-box-containing protein
MAFELDGLDIVAAIHTMGAFFLMVFVIAHIYLTTTGHKPMSSIKAMVTGWEEMDEKEAREMVISEMEHGLKKAKAYLSTNQDKSKFLDEALEETEVKLGVNKCEKFRDVVSNSGAGYFKINADGIYKEVNQAWANLYKFKSPSDVIGKHYRLSRSEEALKELDATFAKVMKGETVEHGIVMRKCQDGTVGYHTITMTPWGVDDEILGVEGFILNVDQKNLAAIQWDKK